MSPSKNSSSSKLERAMRSDLLIRRVDARVLAKAKELRVSIIAYYEGDLPKAPPKIEAYRYMNRPDICCPMPVVEATEENIERVLEYNRRRANRIRAVLLDFNKYRKGELRLERIREGLMELYRKGIPVIFGSGAGSPEELVGPAVLRAATRVLIAGVDPASSIVYRRFYEGMGRVLGGSRAIKKVL